MTGTARRAMRLGVNIDHVATLRQARGTDYPNVLQAAYVAADAGADLITVHLREDRRHIQDRDVVLLRETLPIPLNLEMALTAEMVDIALSVKPDWCCLVPEKREELTTEGGLDITSQQAQIKAVCKQLQAEGIKVSLFVDADEAQLRASQACGANAVELHTGQYGDAKKHDQHGGTAEAQELERIAQAAQLAQELGLGVHAGHGLHYHNVQAITEIDVIQELNIGHAIVARAVFTGLDQAVREMKRLMQCA